MSHEKATELVKEAVQGLQSGKLDQAIDLARKATEEDELHSGAYGVLGIALSRAGRPDEATKALQLAVQKSPYDASAYYNLALHYYGLGNKNDTIAMAQEAIRCEGKHKRANELLKKVEEETHVEVAPYQTSLGDERGAAYRYKREPAPDDELPPLGEPPQAPR
ncbi:MAG: tetratricopeptide repeat protein [Armatimonadetes bacterium]|nr:tetratricopeptide repeat protein [Armatimonadota bacterium]